ncbi:MAG: glycosyltransferase family 9 protein [Acidobacteria bacterium]|nr:glycosyltransferase family 9 protein [Acidobacteriota bacterium]
MVRQEDRFVRRLRRADRWLGTLACLLLTGVRRLVDREDRSRPAQPRRIAFIKLAEQGSTVLAYPALQHAVRTVGRENVFFVAFSENVEILRIMDVIPDDQIITFPGKPIGAALLGAVGALRRLRRLGIDTAIDLEFFARSSAALTYLTGARWRVGFHPAAGEAGYRGDLMTHRLSFNPYLHTVQTFQVMVQALDCVPRDLPALDLVPPPLGPLPVFTPRDGEQEEVRAWLRDLTGPAASPRVILLNANASDLLPLRRWPADRYVALAQRLVDRCADVHVGFTGAPNEAAAVEELVRAVGSNRCFSLAGRTTVRQLLIVYTLAEVLVTNDSGPAHFAAMTPIDVVTLFGPETPRLFGAPTPRNHVRSAGLPCSPCVNAYNGRSSACTNNICMQRISVDEVFETVAAIYERRRGEPADVRSLTIDLASQ